MPSSTVTGRPSRSATGAAYAQDPTLAGLARLEESWVGLDREGILPPQGLLPNALALFRRGEAVHHNDKLRGLLEGMLQADTFEDLRVRFQCVATDVMG